MNDQEINAAPPSFSVTELQTKIDAIRKSIIDINKNDLPTAIEGKKQELLKQFREQLLAEKDRFKNVFRTEHGSLYFTLLTGESLRIKQVGNRQELKPICGKVFYTDAATAAQLGHAVKESHSRYQPIVNQPITTGECVVGAIPVEFGIIGMPPINFEEVPGRITILGDRMGDFASGFHYGHPITEVIK